MVLSLVALSTTPMTESEARMWAAATKNTALLRDGDWLAAMPSASSQRLAAVGQKFPPGYAVSPTYGGSGGGGGGGGAAYQPHAHFRANWSTGDAPSSQESAGLA